MPQASPRREGRVCDNASARFRTGDGARRGPARARAGVGERRHRVGANRCPRASLRGARYRSRGSRSQPRLSAWSRRRDGRVFRGAAIEARAGVANHRPSGFLAGAFQDRPRRSRSASRHRDAHRGGAPPCGPVAARKLADSRPWDGVRGNPLLAVAEPARISRRRRRYFAWRLRDRARKISPRWGSRNAG